jgi:MOSC domain-containing protein YiiM
MQPLESAILVRDSGMEGCAHARSGGKRQILIIDLETLDAVELAPGVVRENITTEGINVNGLALGERLRVGPAVLEVSAVCTPCDQLEKVRPGLRRELYGRRGMLCKVIEGGAVRPGDVIERV